MYSLHYAPDRSVAALTAIANSTSHMQFSSECVLKHWVAGTWQIGRPGDPTEEISTIKPEPEPERPLSPRVSGSLDDLTKCPPLNVKQDEIGGQKRIHERVSFANLCCDDCINYEGPDLTFRPDETFPPTDHILAWIWSIRPDLGAEIASIAGPKLSKLVSEYIEAADLYE
jgi:hypothetical protein